LETDLPTANIDHFLASLKKQRSDVLLADCSTVIGLRGKSDLYPPYGYLDGNIYVP
jgi:hypothetical protein